MQNREMKKILDAQKEKTSAKQREFENLNVKLSDLQHLINLNSTVSSMQDSCGSVERSTFNSIISQSEGNLE